MAYRPVLTGLPQTQESYSQIELDDLNDSHAYEGIALDMKDSQRYFESRAINKEDASGKQKVRVVWNLEGFYNNAS
jgi:hypothetical protein